MKTVELLRSLDWVLAVAAGLLVLISLAMLFSSTSSDQVLASRFGRQLVALALAVIVGFAVARIPYHSFKQYWLLFYVVALIGLMTVLLTGRIIRGTASRLEIVGFQLQPSEFMKVAVILAVAWLLARKDRITWRLSLQVAVLIGVPTLLVLLEPDLGVAALMVFLGVGLIIFAGLKWKAVAGLSVVGLAGVWAAWVWLLADYQKARLAVFLDPASDPLGAGYNVRQSMVALGSGGWLGRGLGHGPQSQLQFLPERHTDFFLASLGEELGLLGVVVVLLLYAIVLWRILRVARQTQDKFGQLLAVGVFWLLLISLLVGAGMNMGILPVTGIPLPLLSYGGSNLVSTFMLLGIVQSVYAYSKWVQAPPMEFDQLT